MLFRVVGAFGFQLEQKIQSLSNDPEHRGFVFFSRKKMLDHLFLSLSFSFNHPELVVSTVLEKHIWKYIFKSPTLSGPLLPLEGLRAPLHSFPHISGEWGRGGVQNAGYSQKEVPRNLNSAPWITTSFTILRFLAFRCQLFCILIS